LAGSRKSKELKTTLAENLAKLPLPATAKWPEGVWDVAALAHGTMSVILFTPRGKDYQTLHEQDELYFIVQGTSEFVMNDERFLCAAGDVLFVPANVIHRFENFSDDFQTWAVFYGPQGGEVIA
jgi:mannose-6-phosphate isomerase-like protein (cupin superfamily)